MDYDDLKDIVDIIIEKDLYVISDEIYSDYLWKEACIYCKLSGYERSYYSY